MKRRLIVYGLVDPRSDELRYVGKSTSGLIRPRSHFCPSNLTERTHKGHWVKSLVTVGLRPQIVILEEVPEDASLNEAEEFFIAYFRFLGCRLTNATKGGDGARGVKRSEASRAKQSAATLGRKKSPAHRAAIAAALKGHAVPDVVRRKIADAHRGNTYCVGRKLSPESRAKMSESVKRTSWVRGKKMSEETRRKMSEVARNRRRNPDGTYPEGPAKQQPV